MPYLLFIFGGAYDSEVPPFYFLIVKPYKNIKMIKSNQLLLPLLVLMAAGLLIAGGYILLSDEKPSDDKKSIGVLKKEYGTSENNNLNQNISRENISYENSYIEEKNDVISPETVREMKNDLKTIQNANLTRNTKPSFNIGDKFLYEFMVIPTPKPENDERAVYFDRYNKVIGYEVVDRIRVDKTQYFKIQKNSHEYIIGIRTTEKGPEPKIIHGVNETIYLNVDTGEIFIGVETNNIYDIQKAPDNNYIDSFTRPWMYALQEDIKWRQNVVEFTPHQVKSLQEERGKEYNQEVQEFYVEGIEKIGGRECFKVKEEKKFCSKGGMCKIENKRIYYIDVEKRILVKLENWWQNLNVGEIRLIE